MAKRPAEPQTLPFAAIPHGIMSDPRITGDDSLLLGALLNWAYDRDHCMAPNWMLGAYSKLSVSTVQRRLRHLEAIGYIKSMKVTPTPQNMTGRVVALLWRSKPSIVPKVPKWSMKDATRKSEKSIQRVGQSSDLPFPVEGRSELRPTGSVKAETQRVGQSSDLPGSVRALTDKEESYRKKTEEPLKKPEEFGPISSTTRLQIADSKPDPEPAEEHPAPAATNGTATEPELPPAEIPLAPGQLQALEALSPDERAVYEQQPPAVRLRFLARFEQGFDQILLSDARQSFRPPTPPQPVIPAEATTAELLEALGSGNRDPTVVPRATNALILEFKDHVGSWPYINKICDRVWKGELPADCLVEPYKKVRARLSEDPPPKKPAAYFTRAIENWIETNVKPLSTQELAQ